MPFNQTKIYNELLDILSLNEAQRTKSLRLIFERDFVDKSPVFQKKEIYPTPQANGEIPMDTLFRHLTTEMQDTQTRHRIFEKDRSMRLHWVRFHLGEKKRDNMLLFSVKEPEGYRTYYYDKDEKYVIVLEPMRDGYYKSRMRHISKICRIPISLTQMSYELIAKIYLFDI